MKYSILIVFVLLFSQTVLSQEPAHRPKVGLVLSGGVARGFAHIGVLKVLEEAGMPVDFIGGTSMGSLIGGLYAIGYSADSIKQIALSQNWAELFTDRTPRKYLSIEEKEKQLKYFVTSPISNGKIKLPAGAVSGQNLEILFSRLTWNYIETDRFALFPIPFLCVATDIETGEPAVLQQGSLAHAMRASMSVPGFFTPEVIDNKILIDGGVSNNFPVEDVKKMGADILIGVDVGFEQYNKSELNSAANIIEQSFFIYTVDENTLKQKKCDILIKPELKHFALTEFHNAKEIIEAGELAARKQFPRLKMLADFIKGENKVQENEPGQITEKINIVAIGVSGNKKVPTNYILSKFEIKPPAKASCQDVEDGIQRIYGSQFFSKTEFSVHHLEDGDSISISVKERPQELFSFGANYNSDLNASLLFNVSLYNNPINGSKLFADAVIGQSPSLNVVFLKQLDWNRKKAGKNQLMAGINLSATSLYLGNYANNKIISNYRLNSFLLNLYSEIIVRNSFAVSVGIQNEFINATNELKIFNTDVDNSLFNFYGQIKFDTYNNIIFPESGARFYGQARYLTDVYDAEIQPGILADAKFSIAVPIINGLTLIPSVFSGISLVDSIPTAIQYRLGGYNNYYSRNSFAFSGYHFMELLTSNIVSGRLDIQYKILNRHFIILSANAGKTSVKLDQLFKNGSSITGYSLTYGYNSIIGPLQLSVMNSKAHKIMAYINVGLWF